MTEIVNLYDYCLGQKSCTSCKLTRNGSHMQCEFKRKPCYWDVDRIKKAIKEYKNTLKKLTKEEL